VPGSPVVLESEADRRLRRFARADQADQRHDPDQPGSAHHPALCLPSPIPETPGRPYHRVSERFHGSGPDRPGRRRSGAGSWPYRRPAAEGRPGRVRQGSRPAGRRALVSSVLRASVRHTAGDQTEARNSSTGFETGHEPRNTMKQGHSATGRLPACCASAFPYAFPEARNHRGRRPCRGDRLGSDASRQGCPG
jgi:hypothetical protein